MKKKFSLLLITSTLMGSLFACSQNKSDNIPDNELTRIFRKIKENNFTVYNQERKMNNDGQWRNQTFRYTNYALEQEGGVGIAQGKDEVFRYNIVNGEVVSSLPLYDNISGVRYDTIFEYTYGMQDVDLSALPTEKDEEGWYTYDIGASKANDFAILPVFLRFNPLSPVPPESLKMRVVGDNLELDAVLLDYKWEDQPDAKDIAHITVHSIGTTENPEVKKYLDDGRSAKKPLDMRFYKVFNSYLSSYNFTIQTDASKVSSIDGNFTIKYTEDAEAIQTDSSYYGWVYANTYVSQFQKESDKLKIITTPKLDESSYYSYLYGEKIEYSFPDILYSNLIGYIDEEHDNSYIITDSQFITIFGYICNVYVQTSQYASSVRIEILDDKAKSFKAYFDFVDQESYKELGTYVVTFSDVNNTVIPEVDRYLARGEKPSTQKKEDFIKVMNEFKKGNYSIDMGIGKYYFTNNYRYFESYSSDYHDYGIIKEGEHVYEFEIVDGKVQVDKKTDYGNTKFPSTGTFFLAEDDFGYMSTFKEDKLYDFDKYYVASSCGEEYWKNDELSMDLYNYILGSPSLSVILPKGTGIMVQDGEDPYDRRVTFVTTFASVDETQEGSISYTFYDIGSTSVPLVEEYLKTQSTN